jgi:hypothetical protein
MAIPRFKLVSGPTHIQNVPEAASQAFLQGDLVFMSSDAVTICTGTAQGASGIFGVAAANASGTTGADCPVYVATPEQVWRAFPGTSIVPTASFDVGVDYKLAQSSAGAGVLGAAGADAVIASFNYGGNVGTTAGDPILIRFDADACQARLG